MTPVPPDLVRSPEFYPHSFDPVNDAVYTVRFAEADYVRASFLDERALQAASPSEWTRWRALAQAVDAAGLGESCAWIFHIGHVGSTLLSRLIGSQPTVLSLREPLPLRTLANIQRDLHTAESPWSAEEFERRLSVFIRLWSRSFRSDQLAVVKATSFCSELAARIMARDDQPRAVALNVAPEVYLATIFAGQNNHIDILSQASHRLRRLHRRLGQDAWKLHDLPYGQTVAMSWAAETTALTATAAADDRVLWLDFDVLLKSPREQLALVFRQFGRTVSADEIDLICRGPDLFRYSKAPEHGYDSNLRRQVLDQARREHAPEIRAGLRWLDDAAAKFPIIAAAIEAGERAREA
jgi:hypothetical protein